MSKKTTKCKHCKSDIPKGAKICASCGKKQRGLGKWIIIILAIIIIFAGFGGSGDNNDNSNSLPSNTDVNVSDNSDVNTSNLTLEQTNALKKANDYLSFTAFSYDGLIEQLLYEQFRYVVYLSNL